MPRLDVATKTLRTPDETTLAYYDTGGDKPPVVFANGLGGPFSAWKYQVEYLRDRYRLLSWDYRGLGAANRNEASPVPAEVAPPTHASDLLALMDAEHIDRAAFIGWSIGAQVLLELYRRAPERVSHLVFVNGTFGRPFETVAVPLAARVIPLLFKRVQAHARIGSALLQRATRWPETVLWLKRLGFIGSTVDADLFRELAAEFAEVDLETYLRALHAAAAHEVASVLDTVRVPTLLIAGDRDAFTPRDVAAQISRRMAYGELLVVRGGTHYTALEYPELVNLRIEKFFRERGY